jgi:hypothetical protein
MHLIPRFALPVTAAILVSASGIAPAHAGDDGRALSGPLLPKYREECASCHLAYPPGLLPASSWQRILNNLAQHYGTDASLDPSSRKEVGAWLAANAGTYKRVNEPPQQDRITRSAWFVREHDEVAARTWRLPAVKSAANCTACHTQADKGDFNEHNLRIPR